LKVFLYRVCKRCHQLVNHFFISKIFTYRIEKKKIIAKSFWVAVKIESLSSLLAIDHKHIDTLNASHVELNACDLFAFTLLKKYISQNFFVSFYIHLITDVENETYFILVVQPM